MNFNDETINATLNCEEFFNKVKDSICTANTVQSNITNNNFNAHCKFITKARCTRREKRRRLKAYRKNKFPVSLRKQIRVDKHDDKWYNLEMRIKMREKYIKKQIEIDLADFEESRVISA